MLAMREGDFVMPFGSPGSEVLGQAQLRVFLNVNAFNMSPQAAIEAPRFASYSWPGWDTTWSGGLNASGWRVPCVPSLPTPSPELCKAPQIRGERPVPSGGEVHFFARDGRPMYPFPDF